MMLRRIGYPVVRFRQDMDRLLEGLFEDVQTNGPSRAFGQHGFPSLNVWEEGASLYAEAEVPGLDMEDLEIFVQGDELTLKGERKAVDREDATYHRRECGVGRFSRVLRLPVEVDADQVEATLRHGVLTITLPKVQTVLPRKIEVQS